MDTIDVSNLNRQFLFRKKDVGRFKAEVAAEFVRNRVPGVNIEAHCCKIQEFDESYYSQFKLIVAGLDAVGPRRWINSLLVSMVQFDDAGNPDIDTVIPLIDGGTEGLQGQARVILPTLNACFECTMYTFPPQVVFPMCTIANTPRLPEHCIQYANVVMWPDSEQWKDVKFDGDDPEHVTWVFEKASARAKQFGIRGVTYMLTQGVVKNIIPAIASTNATIAACCANEAFKLATGCCGFLNNNYTYNGVDGVFSNTFEYEKDPECLVCAGSVKKYSAAATQTLGGLVDALRADNAYKLVNPTVLLSGKPLYMPKPPHLEQKLRANLEKPLADLFASGAELSIIDTEALGNLTLTIAVTLE